MTFCVSTEQKYKIILKYIKVTTDYDVVSSAINFDFIYKTIFDYINESIDRKKVDYDETQIRRLFDILHGNDNPFNMNHVYNEILNELSCMHNVNLACIHILMRKLIIDDMVCEIIRFVGYKRRKHKVILWRNIDTKFIIIARNRELGKLIGFVSFDDYRAWKKKRYRRFGWFVMFR